MGEWEKGYFSGYGGGSYEAGLGAATRRAHDQLVSSQGTESPPGRPRREGSSEGDFSILLAIVFYGFGGWLVTEIYAVLIPYYQQGFPETYHLIVSIVTGIVVVGLSFYPPILIINIASIFTFLIYKDADFVPLNAISISLMVGAMGLAHTQIKSHYLRIIRWRARSNRVVFFYERLVAPFYLTIYLLLIFGSLYWLTFVIQRDALMVPKELFVLVCGASGFVLGISLLVHPYARTVIGVSSYIFDRPEGKSVLPYLFGASLALVFPLLIGQYDLQSWFIDEPASGSAASEWLEFGERETLPDSWPWIFAPSILAPMFGLPGLRILIRWLVILSTGSILIGCLMWSGSSVWTAYTTS